MTNPNPARLGHWHKLRNSIETAWPSSGYQGVGVVVGCSGGADSVALTRCLVELARGKPDTPPPQGFVVAAHFNHRLRGDESEGDADFVKRLADELDIRFEIASGDGIRDDEATARDQRRRFFGDVLRRCGARYLVLGHSLDDNVETVLHRLMRGTGPAGLVGISPFRRLADDPSHSDFVVSRPMLGIRRQHIRDALREQGYDWREDRSNQSLEYSRNWIRSELMPMIESQYSEAIPAIGRAIEGQRQWSEAIDNSVDSWMGIYLVQSDPLVVRRFDRMQMDREDGLAAALVSGQAVTIESLRRCWHQANWPLQAMGQPQWNRVYAMLHGDGPGVIALPGSITARRDDQTVTLCRCV